MIYENINELKIRTHGEIYKPYSIPTKFVSWINYKIHHPESR